MPLSAVGCSFLTPSAQRCRIFLAQMLSESQKQAHGLDKGGGVTLKARQSRQFQGIEVKPEVKTK